MKHVDWQDSEPPTREHFRRMWEKARQLASTAMHELQIGREEVVEFPFVDRETVDCFTVFSRRYPKGVDAENIDITTSPDIPIKLLSFPQYSNEHDRDITAFVYAGERETRVFRLTIAQGVSNLDEIGSGLLLPPRYYSGTEFVEFVKADLGTQGKILGFEGLLETNHSNPAVRAPLSLVEEVIEQLHDNQVYTRPFQV